MASLQLPEDGRANKKARIGDPVDSAQILSSLPILDCIKQSDNQLAYLQAQLAATELLYAAYQTELGALAGQLSHVKHSQLKGGLELWKDGGAAVDAAARMSQRQQRMQRQSAAGPWDGDVDTYSDIEEEVLLLQTDDPLDKQQQPGQQGESQHRNALTTAADGSTAAPSPSAASGGGGTLEGNVATGKGGSATAAAESDAADPGPRSSAGVAGAASSSGGGEGTAAAKGETPAAEALEAVRTADAAATAGSGPATACGGDAAREQLEALEATCSAVAQEDMEAQGAIACLAGRTAKYYLRSTAVTLGRITESKGDVDVDLAPEEPPVKGPGSSAPAAPTGGGDQGPGQVQQQQQQAPAGTSSGGAEPASGTQSASSGCRGHVVSRRQAIIRLGPDGQFRLVNMGRQVVTVNDIAVPQNHTVNLPHLSLIEVASVRLIFMANLVAATRVMRRSAALSL